MLCLSMMCALGVAAQTDTVVKKFGDVSPEDFEPTVLELMGGYKAIILQNQRSNYFDILHPVPYSVCNRDRTAVICYA